MTATHSLQKIQFTVDAELLRELGERLVGRQYIALAELVKNSYDADASRVEIRISDDCIEVSDNGHGMTYGDFAGRWMRVGSPHKVAEMRSPELKRRLTGSKGVGRLAVQFLARELELNSVPNRSRFQQGSVPRELYSVVDWDSAVRARDLTHATALYELREPEGPNFPLDQPHGTTVTLGKLKHDWTPKDFEDLAREVWFLQPPFSALTGVAESENADTFEVELIASDPKVVSAFNDQMPRILDLYSSRLVGRLLPNVSCDRSPRQRKAVLSLELEGQTTHPFEFQLPVQGDAPCFIDELEFEIRIYTLHNRQPYGIPVQQARNYLAQWGGVHIYDAGFRIPYAGPAADWLSLEIAHSHRLAQSKLLPPELNVPDGLNFLPTNSRVLGVVNIDTAHEGRISNQNGTPSNQHLQIQVSRDRLVSNKAFHQLGDAVRFALDYYATRLAALRIKEKAAKRAVESPRRLVQNVWDVLERHEDDIPKPVASRLKTELTKTIDSVREESEWTRRQSGLLGAMATIGSTAIAFDHQFNQQLRILEHHNTALHEAIKADPRLSESIGSIVQSVKRWLRDVRATRLIFSPVSDERNRTMVTRFIAKPLVRGLADDLQTILRGVNVDVSGIDRQMLLPRASYPVWMAIFHNVFMNAANAMFDSDTKLISASSFKQGRRQGLRVQDTGVGIDLAQAESLFEPLTRGLELSAEQRTLGYGGTGLGLAIIRMLATDANVDVAFIEPTAAFSTCIEIAWSETS